MLEIEHIFESGANEIRIFNMIKNFIEKRYHSTVNSSCEGNCGMNYSDENGCVDNKSPLLDLKEPI